MRILVTGASGLLGLNVALESAKTHTVIGSVNRHPFRTETLTVVGADFLASGTLQRLLAEVEPDWVIHCAALADVAACEANPVLARRLNSEVPSELAVATANCGVRLLHVSTDAVFDGKRRGYAEEDPPNPSSVYAQTKLDGERAVADLDPTAIIARVNLFGWSMSGERSIVEFFLNGLRSGKPMMGFTDVEFCPLLANDLADIFLKMLSANLTGVYNVVSVESISKYDFGIETAREFGLDQSLISPSTVADSGSEATLSPSLSLRPNKLAQDLGEHVPGWRDGLKRLHDLSRRGYPQSLRNMKTERRA